MYPSPIVPRVSVLLATFNGGRWLGEQVDSILRQEGVQVRIVASDDGSTDDTVDLLKNFEASGDLRTLPYSAVRFGNANRNFMRLIAEAPIEDADWVAFADQDDVWLPNKLRRAVDRLEADRLDAYSSDVVAFWPNGREHKLVKSWPARSHDHLFESAGPGCTFVLPRARFLELKDWVLEHRAAVNALKVHDWVIYALARSRGWRWEIDSHPGLRYRQHGGNEVGANVGWRAGRARLAQALSGQYVADALAIASLVGIDTPLVHRMQRLGWRDRLVLAASASECRRRPAEGWLLALLFLVMRRPLAARH